MAVYREKTETYEIKDGNLHHALIEVGCPVFDDLDSHNFLGLKVLTLHDLSEGTLTENVQDEVSIPRPRY